MLALLVLEAATSFVPPSAGGSSTPRSMYGQARTGQLRCQGGFKLPKIDFGGIEFEVRQKFTREGFDVLRRPLTIFHATPIAC